MREREHTASGMWLPVDEPEGLPRRVWERGAFLPRPLPAELVVSAETVQGMSLAHHMLGRLYEATARLRDRRLLVRTTQLREAQNVLALEDVYVAFREILTSEVPDHPPSSEVDPRVTRFLATSDDAVAMIGEAPVGETVFWVAAGIAAGSQVSDRVGRDELPWRSEPRWFGGPRPEGAYLLAAPPGADLRGAAEQWQEWVDTTTSMQVVGKVALGAYQLYSLAPLVNSDHLVHFYVTLELIKAGAIQDQCLTISVWLSRNRGRFHELHARTAETGRFDEWVAFFAEGISVLCESKLRLVYALEKERDNSFRVLPDRNDSLARVVDILPSFPVVNAKLVAQRCAVTERQSRSLLQKLEGYALVREIGNRKRNKLYEVPRVMRLLNLYEGEPAPADRAVHDQSSQSSA